MCVFVFLFVPVFSTSRSFFSARVYKKRIKRSEVKKTGEKEDTV